MRRGEIDQKIAAVMCGLAILIVAAGQVASDIVPQPAPAPPAPAPVPVVTVEPVAVYVFDAAGKRADAATEAAAAKMPVGSWRVQGVPKEGETGWWRTIVVGEEGKPLPPVPTPAPPQPGPPKPEPTPPPVVSGKRELMIVRESADVTTPLAAMLVKLRNGPSFDYLKAKGHTLSILDKDSVNESGQPSKLVEAWRPHFAGMTLPVLFIIDAQTRQLVHKQSIPAEYTADNIIERLRENGG